MLLAGSMYFFHHATMPRTNLKMNPRKAAIAGVIVGGFGIACLVAFAVFIHAY